MNCPFCASQWRDLFGLALHLESEHPDKQHSVQVHVSRRQIPTAAVIRLPVIECDIDAIYLKRPDLVGRKAAP